MVAAAIGASVRERMLRKVSETAALFETRWTLASLKRVNANLHEALEDQLAMFHESLVTGEDENIIYYGEGMCRGWWQATIEMEKAGVEDDAYLIGQFGQTVVAIGRQARRPERVRELHGKNVIWVTPREVAALVSKVSLFDEVKALWPDAELIDIREKDGAADD